MQVEFWHTLSTGAEVFVTADVGEDVENVEIMSGDDSSAVPIPIEIILWKDRVAIHMAASDVYAQRMRERREESA